MVIHRYPNCWLSYKVVTESWASREIRVLNRLRYLLLGWKKLLPRGGTQIEVRVTSGGGMVSELWMKDAFGFRRG